MLATCAPGDAVLLVRNCHRAATAALALAGAWPEWLEPAFDPELGVAEGVAAAEVHRRLRELQGPGGTRRVGAVLVVSPTYFGACTNVAAVAEACRAAGVPLIVDEAHGAHLGVAHAAAAACPALPPSPLPALAAGADVVVQSTHKTLGALTQGSMLHLGAGAGVDEGRLAAAVALVQTSSPSYLTLASLDAARLQVAEAVAEAGAAASPGRRAVELAAAARTGLAALPGIAVAAAGPGQDPLRLAVATAGLSAPGFAVAAALEDEFGVVPELALERGVVLVVTFGTTAADVAQLLAAFGALSARRPASGGASGPRGDGRTVVTERRPLPAPETVLSPREAFFAAKVRRDFPAGGGRAPDADDGYGHGGGAGGAAGAGGGGAGERRDGVPVPAGRPGAGLRRPRDARGAGVP